MRHKKIIISAIISFAIFALFFLSSMLAIVVDGLTDEIRKADVVVVLGNEVKKDGHPSNRLQARLQRALEIHGDGFAPLIVVSGGKGKSGFDEATVMADWLVDHGVPSAQVITDSEGYNTYATANNLSQIMQEKHLRSVIVVTQYFHVSRSRMALKRFGLSPVYTAHARYFEWRDIYSTAREVPAYFSYMLRKPQNKDEVWEKQPD